MIGEKINEMLKLRGMRQAELARLTGASKTTINSIIMRNNKNVDFSLMEKIADALDVPIEYFFDRDGDKKAGELIAGDKLTEKEQKFVSAFTALSPQNRHTLLVIAEALLRDQSEHPDPQG
ncbi:MAG: helix-turn-helix transcriptional regulator [Clostridiales bacterium]|nr:helix-turn-helix transcriptional regulator [Clostridiales bacterium]